VAAAEQKTCCVLSSQQKMKGCNATMLKANADSESMRAALGFLSSIANGAPNAQLANPTAHNNADATAASALQQLAQVMGQGATGTASAMRGVTQAAGQTADWGCRFRTVRSSY
jgi:hypothetical protein